MIFRLEHGNRYGDTVRIDITTPGLPTVVEIEGTGNPFRLKYTPDIPDKSFRFLTSSAEINIYETPLFNIDTLKTSSETDIKVDYYINGVMEWVGFVLPDFFSREIGGAGVVSMTASDRIGTLKGVTLSDLPARISLRNLALLCLGKTGLDLPLKTMVGFTTQLPEISFNEFFRSEILTQRFSDTKGRSISCYDILKSILVASFSTLVQRHGEWYIVNKMQHEIGSGRLYSSENQSSAWVSPIHNFSEITKGAMRSIIPVAASVGIFHEFGGGLQYPSNYDFSDDLAGWTKHNGFVGDINNREITNYLMDISYWLPIYGGVIEKKNLRNYRNVFDTGDNNNPYIQSPWAPIPYMNSSSVEVTADLNFISTGNFIIFRSYVNYAVVARSPEGKMYGLSDTGKFVEFTRRPFFFRRQVQQGSVVSLSDTANGVLSVKDDFLDGYEVAIRIYGSGSQFVPFVNSASLSFKSPTDNPKGTVYKREQGNNYTKSHDIETSIFGDYITGGLNGYFYDYPIDDTSSLYSPNGNLRERWIDPTDHNVEELPLLQHVVRQKARMFSVAHDLIRGEIEMVNFDPLAIFVDCNGKRYSIVSAEVDFLNSNVNLEIEEIAYKKLTVRDFIYSYFGEGESNIKSVGGIASGSGGGGVDLGIIGGINDRIDEVGQRMDDIKVGVSNLLRNTGFLGDFTSLEVDAITAVLEETPVNTNPLVHWVHVNAEVIDAPSRSGKGVKIGSLQQNVDLRAGESYVLSFMAKGTSLTVNLVDSLEVELTNEFKRYSFDIVAPNTGSFIFWITDPSLSAEVYEIMLSEGNTDVDYAYAAEDDLKAISQLQAINAITSVIKEYDTATLGGLILTSMIQLGKYKDGKMEEVNAGISGIYNNDDDPAAWFGGNLEKAIRTVQRLKSNPYSVSEEEWEDLANIVFTHGGDGFFKGIIYALGGIFRGRVESNAAGNRIIINPEQRAIELRDDNNDLIGQIFFTDAGWGAYQLYEYYESGSLKKYISVDSQQGIIFRWYDNDNGPAPIKSIEYRADGNIYNGELPDMTDEAASAALAPNQWYRTGRIVKINI